jgi:TrmH family RNA methyltransferase
MPYSVDNISAALVQLERIIESLGLQMLAFCRDSDVRFFFFGRDIILGAMAVKEDESLIEAFIAAGTERAARDLLSWFPYNKDIKLHIHQSWLVDRISSRFDLEAEGDNIYSAKRTWTKLPQGVAEFHARVDSQKHPVVDMARRLQTEKGRDELDLYAAHGPLLLARALAAKAPIAYVLYTPKLSYDTQAQELLQGIREARIPNYLITEGLMRKCVDTAYVPTVLTILQRNLVDVDDLYLGSKALTLVCESVEEPGNLGMILRTADAVSADAVLVCGTGCDPFSWKTVTGSRGSIFRVPVVFQRDTGTILQALKNKGQTLLAADLTGTESHFGHDYTASTGFLLGNESEGLTQFAVEMSDIRMRIPMPGEPDSLNVGVSAAVLLYEALRQRML